MSVWKIQSEVWLWDFGLRSIILCHFLSRGDIELPGGRFQHFLISLLLFYLFIFLSSVFLFCSLAQRSLHRVHYSWGVGMNQCDGEPRDLVSGPAEPERGRRRRPDVWMTNSEKLGKMFVLPKPVILHFLVYTQLYFPVTGFSLDLSFFLCRSLSIHSSFSVFFSLVVFFCCACPYSSACRDTLKKKTAFALADICSLSYLSG